MAEDYLDEVCFTCKCLHHGGYWKVMPEACEKHLREVWGNKYEEMIRFYVCDFYRRKNSGAFRRKCRKQRRERNA